MKLSEKILHCRKKLGCSQEALAEKLGVSRQAVSKWETGESEPEIGKLRRMAEIFHVSVDWLLSEEEPQTEQPRTSPEEAAAASLPQWLEHLPKYLRRIIRRYGWLGGLVISLHGLVLALAGGAFRWMSRKMMMANMAVWAAEAGSVQNQMPSNPVDTLGGVVLAVGVVVIIAGLLLSLFLRRKFR